MQKIINVLAVASAAVSVAVVGSGLYVYVNRASILDGVKSQVMEAVTGALPGMVDTALPEIPSMPSSTGDVMPMPTPDMNPNVGLR